MSPIHLAILSPSSDQYSETFIQAHRRIKGMKIYFYSGGFLPKVLEKKGQLEPSGLRKRLFYRLLHRLNNNDLTFNEWLVFQSFKKEKIQAVLAEYGPTACAILQICKKANVPLFVHFHGYDASKKHILATYKDAYKRVFSYASGVIAVSHVMKKTLANIGCPEGKLMLNPYGPDQKYFTIEPHYNTNNFVSVGRFVDKKAPYYLILAFQKVLTFHPDAKLVLIGDGVLQNVCKNLVQYYKMGESIQFEGVKTSGEISTIFENSLGYVQHSITAENGDMEGTPVAILEASAAGLPVISTNHAGIPDVVVHQETGLLCNEHDINQMADNMVKLLENKELARQMGQQGRKRIKEHFQLERHLDMISIAIKSEVKPSN